MTVPTANDGISALNDLIETCRESESYFRAAAREVQNPRSKQLFERYAQQRLEFALELEQAVHRLGGLPETNPPAARRLADLKTPAPAGDTGVIAELERAEDQAIKSYREALGAYVPSNIRAVIERQLREVEDTHETLKSLEQRRAA